MHVLSVQQCTCNLISISFSKNDYVFVKPPTMPLPSYHHDHKARTVDGDMCVFSRWKMKWRLFSNNYAKQISSAPLQNPL